MIEIKWLILIFIVNTVFRIISHYKCSKTTYRWKYYKHNEFFGVVSILIYWGIGIYLFSYYLAYPFLIWYSTL